MRLSILQFSYTRSLQCRFWILQASMMLHAVLSFTRSWLHAGCSLMRVTTAMHGHTVAYTRPPSAWATNQVGDRRLGESYNWATTLSIRFGRMGDTFVVNCMETLSRVNCATHVWAMIPAVRCRHRWHIYTVAKAKRAVSNNLLLLLRDMAKAPCTNWSFCCIYSNR